MAKAVAEIPAGMKKLVEGKAVVLHKEGQVLFPLIKHLASY